MKLQDAMDLHDGKKRLADLDYVPDFADFLMLSMGACKDGDQITCLKCGFPNECCDCGREGET
jgi:hypothetical protein